MKFNNEEFIKLNIKLIDFMDDLVRVFDKDGFIVYLNNRMKEFYEQDDEGKFCKFENRNMDQNLQFSSLRCIDPMSTNESVVTDIVEIKNKVFLVKSSPIYDDNNVYWGSIEVFRDVTREQKLKKNVEKYISKINGDMIFASEIQKSLLPKKGQFSGLDFDYRYISSDGLSGDFFDIVEIDDRRTCVYIADVMGHGVVASMITMFIKFSVRSIIQNKKVNSPSEILSELTKEFVKLDLELYFTIFFGVYDKEKMELEYSNAGHNCIPILFNKDTNILLELSGLPISWLFTECRYSEGSVKLKKEDNLFFYTDGLIETKNKNDEFYGEKRLIDLIDSSKNSPEINILDKIIGDINTFRHGKQEDDIAIVNMKIM